MNSLVCCCVAFSASLMLVPGFAEAGDKNQPIPVEVVQNDQGEWQILRGGEPYYVKGGCRGAGLLEELAAAGGNSIRLWSTGPGTMEILDQAHELGLTVMVGLWMGQPIGHQDNGADGFNYADPIAVQAQIDALALKVDLYKNHPAILAWGVGNELEHLSAEYDNGDQEGIELIWSAINDTAAMVKERDPLHPTIAVTAEMGAWHMVDNCTRITEFCSNIDIWGINAYETLYGIHDRVEKCVWDRPYLITEFGPMGWWSGPRTTWGSPIEHATNRKAQWMQEAWEMHIEPNAQRCLGGYAFVWDVNQGPTDTWWTVFTDQSEPTESVDALMHGWTGAYPENRSPVVMGIDGMGSAIYDPTESIQATLVATDPEGENLSVEWLIGREVFNDAGEYGGMSPGCTYVGTDSLELDILAPVAPGTYRLIGIARDEAGRAGIATKSFLVDGETPDDQVPMPFAIDDYYAPTGWMGSSWAMTSTSEQSPLGVCGGVGHKFTWNPPPSSTWTGVVWQYPENNWGALPGLDIMPGATGVRFMAWLDIPDTVKFFVGSPDADGFEVSIENVEVTTEPQWFEIPLEGVEYEDIAISFGWVMSRGPWDTEPTVLHITDLTFDGPPPPPPCRTDINNDRMTDGWDLGMVIADWFEVGDLETDLNESGWVDGADIAVLLANWGPCPE